MSTQRGNGANGAGDAATARVPTADEIRRCQQLVGSAGLALVNKTPQMGLVWARIRPRARVPGPTQGGTWEMTREGDLFCDVDFTLKLSLEDAKFILMHEWLHPILDHIGRAITLGLVTPEGYVTPGREVECQLFGWANDMVINHTIVTDGLATMPKGELAGLLPPPEYVAERGPIESEALYYWMLKRTQNKQPFSNGNAGAQMPAPKAGQQPFGQGAPKPGQGCLPLPKPGQGQEPSDGTKPGQGQKPGEGAGAPKPGQGKIDWAQLRREVEAFARQAGTGSALAELVAARPSRTDYKRVIRAGAEAVSHEAEERSRRTYSRIARRPEVVAGILRPGHIGTTGTLACVCDVSGSVSRKLVGKIAGELMRVCEQFPGVKVIFVAHTDQVEHASVLRPGGDAKAIVEGLAYSGGTDAKPAYAKVREMNKGKPVDTLIHFTDCELCDYAWPDAPGKQLVIGECGLAAVRGSGTPRPKRARRIPVLE